MPNKQNEQITSYKEITSSMTKAMLETITTESPVIVDYNIVRFLNQFWHFNFTSLNNVLLQF